MAESDTSYEQKVVWANLPNDCLNIIFSKLKNHTDRNSFGLSCRRWFQIQNSARTSLTFHYCVNRKRNNLFSDLLLRLLNRFPNLGSISLAGCTELPDLALAALRDCGSTLRCLSLYCCLGISDIGLSMVGIGCPRLVSIALYRCKITDTGLNFLAKSCPLLENINVSYCMLISDVGISSLSRDCAKLHAVIISCCKGITAVGFHGCSPTLAYLEADSCSLTPEGLLGACSGGGLEYLNISNMRSWLERDGLGSIGAGFATQLRYLNLRMCRFVGDSSVSAIAKGCPLLMEWNVAVCHEIRITGWEAIGSHCKSLKILHVNRCRNLYDRGLQALGEGCLRLKVMYMHGCQRVTQLGVDMFKLLRQEVELKRDECVNVGPSLDKYFSYQSS